jgi:DNA replication and repair protein RecF
LKGSYGQDLKIYDRALRSRNLLLREGGHAREIAAYNIPLSESGDRIMNARRELVNALSPLAAAACRGIAGESLELEYQPGASQPLLEDLLRCRDEELRLRLTRVGPQRDDVGIRLDGIPAGAYASEGQRRTIAVALKLAVAGLIQQEHKRPPILLLDDIFGELDPPRRNALLHGIPEESQVFISTADLAGIALPAASTSLRLDRGILHHI